MVNRKPDSLKELILEEVRRPLRRILPATLVDLEPTAELRVKG